MKKFHEESCDDGTPQKKNRVKRYYMDDETSEIVIKELETNNTRDKVITILKFPLRSASRYIENLLNKAQT